jgi:DNA modification methylase
MIAVRQMILTDHIAGHEKAISIYTQAIADLTLQAKGDPIINTLINQYISIVRLLIKEWKEMNYEVCNISNRDFDFSHAHGSDRPDCTHEWLYYFLKPTATVRPMANFFDRDILPQSVVSVPTVSSTAHPCPYPLGLASLLVRAVCPPGGLVLDPFAGEATTLAAAFDADRQAIGIELNPATWDRAVQTLSQGSLFSFV